MYGALEVYSKSSLGAYLSAHHKCLYNSGGDVIYPLRCEQSFPFGAWGEDKYMTNCLEMLGCKAAPALEPQTDCGAVLLLSKVVDFGNFLHDERCWGVDCGNKWLAVKGTHLDFFRPRQAVAFHAFKDVNHWYNCWLVSNHHGF